MASLSSTLFACRRPLAQLPGRAVGPCRFSTCPVRLRTSQSPASKAIRSPQQTPRPHAPSPKQPARSKPPSSAAPSRYAFIKSLASKQTPTVLYEGPSHFWFYFGCWSSGVSIIAWTALTGPTVVQQPEGTPQWVCAVFGASYVLLGAMGFYLISKTPNIVKTIRVLPPAGGASAPLMEVTVKRMVPLLQPKVITTNLESVSLQSRFSLPDEYVPALQRIERQRQEEEQRKALRKFDMNHLFTMPFRHIARVVRNMFNGVRAAWTDMGYGVIVVDGKNYKVDVTQGFAHDGFLTLERLVAVGTK